MSCPCWADTWVRPYGGWREWAKPSNTFCHPKARIFENMVHFLINTEEVDFAKCFNTIVGADLCVRP